MKERTSQETRGVDLSGRDTMEIQTALMLLAKGRLKTLSDEADMGTMKETCEKALYDIELCRKIGEGK